MQLFLSYHFKERYFDLFANFSTLSDHYKDQKNVYQLPFEAVVL